MSQQYDYDRDDPTFLQDLEKSIEHVWIVARWLSSIGKMVAIPPMRVRPDAKKMKGYGDEGDLFIVQDKEWLRIECKQRNLHFTGVHDYPYETIFVDRVHAWERAERKPHAYIVTNEAITVAAIIYGTTSSSWIKRDSYDRGKKRTRAFLECPKGLARFERIR